MPEQRNPDQPVVFFDADCGFCTASAGRLGRLDTDVRIEPIRASTLTDLGIDVDRAADELPVLLPDGTVLWGAAAIAAVLRRARGPLRLVGRALQLPGLRGLAALTYRWVARNRGRLPGGTPACTVASR